MNLFEDVEAENDKYISVIDALEVVAKKIDYSVSDIARRLLLDNFNKIARMFKMNDLENIELWCSEKDFNSNYASTTSFLKLAISTSGTFEYTETDTFGNEHEYTKEFWDGRYWLKSDFFDFPIIEKIGVTEEFYKNAIDLESEIAMYDFMEQMARNDEGKKYKENAKNISINFLKEVEQFGAQKQIDNIATQQNDYKFFLFKKPLLSFHEATCIMTGYDPQYIEQYQNDTNFKQIFSNYLGAKDYIDSCVDAQMLCCNSIDNRLFANDFKNFLANDGTFIDGFNDHLKNDVEDQGSGSQNSIIEQLKKENDQLKTHIAELERQQNNITEPTELNGIHAINQHKSDLQGMARVIASKKWADNHTVLIGTMADTVYREVAQYTTDMPETTDTVKNWIRPVAPVTAQKRGRPPNKN